ncbi:uncharacterized protein CEXT_308391 [Caerostris extrusa]|uniref:GIY-YIG homing endonuclease n=1 Tax=Caerostris extrusa TaxID=172846 RepID=A0AAV4S2Q8_CAEEX|nr:uncharacterized protein CEXT_308391 [Caerostris extrusa]
MVLWRKQLALFKKAVLEAKRKCFDDFISNINYKEDSMKTYKFLSTLQNKRPVPKKEPIYFNGAILTSDKVVANAFGQSYAKNQKKGAFARKMSSQIKKRLEMPKNLNSSHDTHIVFTAPFTLEELRLAIECQRVKKSPGEDNIPCRVFKTYE